MSGKIGITPELMEQRAGDYRRESDEIKGVIGRMDTLLLNLQSEWEGKASQSYAQRYQELRKNFENAAELAEEISITLNKVANQYRDVDNAIANGLMG